MVLFFLRSGLSCASSNRDSDLYPSQRRVHAMNPLSSQLEREFGALAISDVSETGKELGRGSYGEVREADWLGTPCATKRVHSMLVPQTGAAEGGKVSRDFVRECRTWKDLRHPHIVQLLGVVFDPTSPLPVLVMELLSTSLRRFLEEHTKEQFPLNKKTAVMHQVSLALAYLHRQKLIHRDLSTNNILLDTDLETWKAKITDFGVTRVLDATRSRMTGTLVPGTPDFMPPEVFERPAQFSDKVDVFSLGCVIISTLTHQWPEPGPAKRREGGKVVGLTEYQRREHYLALYTPPEKELLLRLTEWCLQEDPSTRPSSGAIVAELAKIREQVQKGSTGEASAVAMQPTRVSKPSTTPNEVNTPQTQSAVTEQPTGDNKQLTLVTAHPPVVEAAKRGQLSRVRQLLDGGAATVEDQDEEGTTALLWASRYGHLPVVKELVDVYNVNVFQKKKDGTNALHMAAQGGHIDVLKYLSTKFGARVHDCTADGYTMLHWASQMGHSMVARYLIQELQLDPQDRDKWGNTALLRVAQGGSVELAKMLLEEYSSSIDEVNESGTNAMHKAAEGGHLVMVKYLAPLFGDRVHEKDKDSFTALHWASQEGHCEVARYLLEELKMDPQDRDKWGYTALLRAAQHGHAELARMLLQDFGSKVDEADQWGYTAMLRAAYNGHAMFLRMLLEEFGSSVDEVQNDGFTAVLCSAIEGHLDMLRELVEHHGADLYHKAKNGYNALHIAAGKGHLEMVKYLLPKFGEKKFDKSNSGETCLDWAIQLHKQEVVDYLLQEGGFATRWQQGVPK